MRRRKTFYPPAKTDTKGGAARPEARATTTSRVVSINTSAMLGRSDVVPGMRVEIASGAYSGEAAVVESVVGGVIPAVIVRTDAGRTRRVRAVDLVPLGDRPDAEDPKPV